MLFKDEFKPQGFIILLALMQLLLMALIAIIFITLQITEKRTSRNFSDDVRAKLVAESGIETAFNKLNNELSLAEPFASEINTVLQKIYINDSSSSKTKEQEISGLMASGTYSGNADVYHIKITDESARINLNDGAIIYGGNNSSVSKNIARIINRLARHPRVIGSGSPSNIGETIIENRPPGGYHSKNELYTLLERKFPGSGRDFYKKLSPYVTLYSWTDKNVANPVPLSTAVKDQYPVIYYRTAANVPGTPIQGGELMRRGRGKNKDDFYKFTDEPLRWFDESLAVSSDNHNAIYGLDELFPGYIEIVHRSPVNVNSAEEPVLVALLDELEGFFIVERRRFSPYAPSATNFYFRGSGNEYYKGQFQVPQNYYTQEWSSYTYDTDPTKVYNVNVYQSPALYNPQSFQEGDEYGFLYKTIPYRSSWSVPSTDQFVSADSIAKHIIACRNQESYGGINYSGSPFSGKFKTWAQFNKFIDFLVEQRIIAETRAIFWDYITPAGAPLSAASIVKVSSEAQRRFASYAAGDVLKANFNPNLHLNETNPDSNLYLRVDKTDLIVNSTEFTFFPSGIFEIQSRGMILKPKESDKDALSSKGNFILAEKRIEVIVKLFDAYRETSQRHFYQGTISPKIATIETSSNTGLEIGPELDNGISIYGDTGPYQGYDVTYNYALNSMIDGYLGYDPDGQGVTTGWGYEYDGYIQLATFGGIGESRTKGDFKPTPYLSDISQHGIVYNISNYEGMHAHFDRDFKCHFHRSTAATGQDKFRDELGSQKVESSNFIDDISNPPGYMYSGSYSYTYTSPYYSYSNSSSYSYSGPAFKVVVPPKVDSFENYADDSVEKRSPYCPDPSSLNRKWRLARSFRLPLCGTSNAIATLYPYAPSDLRIDGAYSERHGGLAYWIDEQISWDSYGGVIAAWVKPSFFPEHTGKSRKVFSLGHWHNANFYYRNPLHFDLYYFPAHDRNPYESSTSESTTPKYERYGAYAYGNDQPPEASYKRLGIWEYPPNSLMSMWNHLCYAGGVADWRAEGPFLNYENYIITECLNHNLHTDGNDTGTSVWFDTTGNPDFNNLEAHKWAHVIWAWYFDRLNPQGGSYSGSYSYSYSYGGYTYSYSGSYSYSYYYDYRTGDMHWMNILVNGQTPKGTVEIKNPGLFTNAGLIPVYSIQALGERSDGSLKGFKMSTYPTSGRNTDSSIVRSLTGSIRLGEVSSHHPQLKPFLRNYSGDFTFDEFNVWRSANKDDATRQSDVNTIIQGARQLWTQAGRYYRPITGSGSSPDTVFQSARIYLTDSNLSRMIPSDSRIAEPVATTTTTARLTEISSESSAIKILGVSWTWYAEDYNRSNMRPVMYDYSSLNSSTYYNYNGKKTARPLEQSNPCCRVMIETGGGGKAKGKGQKKSSSQAGEWLANDYFSSLNKELEKGDALTYKVGFFIEGIDTATSILLATPVFDDITIYFTTGRIQILSYQVNT